MDDVVTVPGWGRDVPEKMSLADGLRCAAALIESAEVPPFTLASVRAHIEDRAEWARGCEALGLDRRDDSQGYDVAVRSFGPVVIALQTPADREARLRDRERELAKREAALAAREGAVSV